MQKQLIQTLKILLAAIVLSFGISYVYAWTGPASAPPTGNTNPPLVSLLSTIPPNPSVTQTTGGKLIAEDGLATMGNVDVIGDITVDGLGVFNRNIKVNGTVEIANTGDACDASTYGQIKFDGANFSGCTSNDAWEPLTAVIGPYTWVIATDVNNFNMENTFGLTNPENIILTINSGVTVGSTDITIPALNTGSLPAGSTVTIINNGTIVGAAGKGGNGGSVTGVKGAPTLYNGGNGSNGGTAVYSSLPLIKIDNNGTIAGGGGGAGGGGAGWCYYNDWYADEGAICVGGGGGGGGGGVVAGSGGTVTNSICIYNSRTEPTAGGSGGSSLGGAKGSGGSAWAVKQSILFKEYVGSLTSGAGGKGGNRGVNGSSGSSPSFSCTQVGYDIQQQSSSPGTGGSAGSKVVGTVTWI